MNNLIKTILIAVMWLFSFALVSLGISAQTKSKRMQKPPAKMIVCKNDDWDCFTQTAEICRKATVTNIRPLELFGIVITATSYSEIKGGRNGNCVFYVKTKKRRSSKK
jgi:hypothetical protein